MRDSGRLLQAESKGWMRTNQDRKVQLALPGVIAGWNETTANFDEPQGKIKEP